MVHGHVDNHDCQAYVKKMKRKQEKAKKRQANFHEITSEGESAQSAAAAMTGAIAGAQPLRPLSAAGAAALARAAVVTVASAAAAVATAFAEEGVKSAADSHLGNKIVRAH